MNQRPTKIRNSLGSDVDQVKKTEELRPPTPPHQIAENVADKQVRLANSDKKAAVDYEDPKEHQASETLPRLSPTFECGSILPNTQIKTTLQHASRNPAQVRSYSTTSSDDVNAILVNPPRDQIPTENDAQDAKLTPTLDPAKPAPNIADTIKLVPLVPSLYPNPKQTLHNYFQTLSIKLKQADLAITPNFALVSQTSSYSIWTCSYRLKWPELIKFSASGNNKRDAAYNAAVIALAWLVENTKITKAGKPLIYDRKEVHEEVVKKMGLIPNYLETNIAETSITIDDVVYVIDTGIHNEEPFDVEKDTPKPATSSAQTVKLVRMLYPTPKQTLHNYFQILSRQLKQIDLNITPHFTPMRRTSWYPIWMCTYSLKWPELMKFSVRGNNKRDTSYKAAVIALAWLVDNKKITEKGKPLIHDHDTEEVTKITKKAKVTKKTKITKINDPVLVFDRFVVDRLNKIVNLYKNNLVKELVVGFGEDGTMMSAGEELQEKWPQADADRFRQKFMGPEFYEAKEPIKLPISDYRDNIIDLLQNNRVLIVKGEPGCGKSTRVPQYVLEAWARNRGGDGEPCRIIVTQPRRIAAISLAERVSNERGERVGDTVGFHVRLKSNFSKRTGRIMYCTTGILLRRFHSDPKLSDCSHVILDEAHERDVNTDLLMNLTRHALELNPNLKVLVMSATMETKVFQDYFGDAPVLHVPGFTYPVDKHFLDENGFPKTHRMSTGRFPSVVHEEVVKAMELIHKNKPEGAILCFLPGWADIVKVKDFIPQRGDVSVLCLHSRLRVSEQRRVFDRPPPGVRKIILATNIAETSITIDDVVYVIDTGIHKEETFDVEKGVNCIDNHWISQASATQRRGRAGRCQAGECFHLYPESKYEQLSPYSVPEILRTSLTKIVLDSKVYSNNMNAVEFLEQLVCPPDTSAIEQAVEELKELELLDKNEILTPLGRTLSDFQLTPKLAKAMVNAVIFKCVTPVIDVATLFSADSALFAKSLGGQMQVKDVKSKFSKTSDHIALMAILEMWLDLVENGNFNGAANFCFDAGLVQDKLFTMQKLREIHFDYLRKGLKDALPLADDFSDNDELIKAVLLSGVGTVLQHRTWDFVKGLLKKTDVLLTRYNQKATITSESVNTRRGKFPSDFLLYIDETISNLRHMTLVRETSVIPPVTVLLFKNGELEFEQLPKENYSDKIKSDDQIILKMQGTKIGFCCDRKQAEAIKECKEALRACVEYYIYQLTKGGASNENVDFYWMEILRNLNQILVSQGIE